MSTPLDESRLVAGRYRLRAVIGAGAMGTVWSAFDEFLHRQVAVKELRLPPGVPASQANELRERTLREARAIAVLSHPSVIVLHDVVREHDDPYIVMELLPSTSLAELTSRGRTLTVPQAAVVADSIAAGLAAAHAAGITHRDVKPGNVLVAHDGRIKITDFGIARNVTEVTLTHTGVMLGSPSFIAPEVASGGAVSYAADLWGLGATLFAITEGRPPYDAGGDALATVTEVVHGTVPPPSQGPLAGLVAGLMVKEPSSRMSLQEVRQRLYPLLPNPGQQVFDPEMFNRDPVPAVGDANETREIPKLPSEPEGGADAAPSAASALPSDSAELAADPGPLPWESASGSSGSPSSATPPPAPRPPSATAVPAPVAEPPRRRGAGRTTALVLVSVLLFALATAGGFSLTRVLAGRTVLPPQVDAQPVQSSKPVKTVPELVSRDGDATNARGAKGGLFSAQVPENWTQFITQQPEATLPASTLVQFVSVDGTQSFGVERFANYSVTYAVDQYIGVLKQVWPRGDFTLVRTEELADGREGKLVTYRTAERGGGGRALNRTTVAEVFLSGGALWIVSVTVPIDQERYGRTQLFDRIMPTFETTAN